ncbi:hypothetical protein QIG19_26805, partial [Klebsiella pneumoniae]|nr:hypothetical protein [Klebsiella pneumoniae]
LGAPVGEGYEIVPRWREFSHQFFCGTLCGQFGCHVFLFLRLKETRDIVRLNRRMTTLRRTTICQNPGESDSEREN